MSEQEDKTPDEIMRELAEKKAQEISASGEKAIPSEMTTAKLAKNAEIRKRAGFKCKK